MGSIKHCMCNLFEFRFEQVYHKFPHQSVVGTLTGHVGTGVSLLSMTMAVRMFRLEDRSPALKGTHVHARPGRQQSGCCGEGGTPQ